MPKRKSNSDPDQKFNPGSKRIKYSDNIDDFHSASTVHNYMLNDPILDYLELMKRTPKISGSKITRTKIIDMDNIVPELERDQGKELEEERDQEHDQEKERLPEASILGSDKPIPDSFFGFITDKGNKFEDRVMDIIKEKASRITNADGTQAEVRTISRSQQDIRNPEKYYETIQAMKDQVPIIYQGVLHGNENFKAFGSPDIMIRADIINLIVDTESLDSNAVQITAPNLGTDKFHYRIIDIKFCTLKLRADGRRLLNSGRMPANKGQIIVYNKLLGIVQGYTPTECYVLGRGWKFSSKGVISECLRCDERLGQIDLLEVDKEFPGKVDNALEWLGRLKKHGRNWKTHPTPSVPELFPNMSNHYDTGPNRELKVKIAESIDDITRLWYCGIKHRKKAHDKGIFRLTDPRLNTDILGLPKNTPRTNLIGKMLEFNQGKIGIGKEVIPEYIDNDVYDWQNPNRVEFFLDLESLSNIFDDLRNMPNRGGENIVFMLGLGVSIRTDELPAITPIPGMGRRKVKWEYYNFRIPELTEHFEFQIFDQMYNKIIEILDEHDQELADTNIYHWGAIEQYTIDRMYTKYYDKHDWEKLNLVDFNKVFKEEGILVKGVYGFGLKEIGKAMIKKGLIKLTSWESVSNGLDAMIQGYKVYAKQSYETELDAQNRITDLIRYNEVDVRMIEKIINYLRKKHSPSMLRKLTNTIRIDTKDKAKEALKIILELLRK
jgi:hypothetical protein